jgi:shikimate kinase
LGEITRNRHRSGGDFMNIILIGMRGSGKSTIGKLLAKKTKRQFFDLDKVLSEVVGMPIPELVKKHGWEFFREKESEVAEKYAQQKNAVLATGGGVILRKTNVNALGKNGKFILLKASIETMVKRLGKNTNRPALTNKQSLREELEEVWRERIPLYEQTAHVTIDTDNKTLDEVIEEIHKLL